MNIDALTISLSTLAGLRLLGMLVFLDLYNQKREKKHLLLILGWGLAATGSAWGLFTHLAWGEMEHYLFSLLAGLGTFWIGCGALLYFSSVSWRFVGGGSLLIILYSLLPLVGINFGPSPGVIIQFLISLLVILFAIFKRKAFREIAESSYFWLLILAALSATLTLAFGLGFVPGDQLALGFAGTLMVYLVAIIFFLHLEYSLSARQLQRSEEKHRNMIQQMLEGCYTATLDGILLDHNLEFCHLLGLDPDQNYRGLNLPDFWQDSADREVYLQVLQKDGLVRRYQVNAKKVDDEKIILLINSRLVPADTEAPDQIEGTFFDVTDRARAEAELRQLKDDLEAEVAKKTQELQDRVELLEQFHDATIEREFRVQELREEIARLKGEGA
jgi:PAS domain S-box-containing protein